MISSSFHVNNYFYKRIFVNKTNGKKKHSLSYFDKIINYCMKLYEIIWIVTIQLYRSRSLFRNSCIIFSKREILHKVSISLT